MKNENFDKAWKLLQEKGLTLGQLMHVRQAFADWGRQFDDDIEENHKFKSFRSKKPELSGYGFGTESEVKFLHALHALSPETKKDVLMTAFAVTIKLLNIESEWQFNPVKTAHFQSECGQKAGQEKG